MEQWYEKEDEKFLRFAESYAPGKTDAPIEEMVLKLYEFSMSYPWPIRRIVTVQVDAGNDGDCTQNHRRLFKKK